MHPNPDTAEAEAGPDDAASAQQPSPAGRTANAVGRSALLRAAIAVGAAEGLSGVTSRSVAEQASVAHSLVRYHFGTIDGLITEALALAIDEGLEHGTRLADTTTLADFTERISASVTERRDIHAFLHEALLESRRRPSLYPQVERYYRDYRAAISAQLERLGLNDPGFVDVIFFAIEGMTMKEVVYPDQLGTRGAIVWLQRRVLELGEIPLGADPSVLDPSDPRDAGPKT